MPAVADAPQYDTVADVLSALGDIPPRRVLWNPYPGTATEADLLREIDRADKRLVELIDGVLVEKAMGAHEGFMAASLIAILIQYVKPRRLGIVGGADVPLRLRPRLVRLPDVSFTSWGRLPADDAHLQPVGDFAPDLAVEVLSASNTRAEMARKRRDYFAAGTIVVWEIEPKDRTVTVYTDAVTHRVYTTADTLPGDPALPGFTIVLAEFFDDPQLSGRWV